PRRRHLDPEDGTREDAPDSERAGGVARGTGERGQADIDRAHIPTPFVGGEGQIDRGTRGPPPGTREVFRLEAYIDAEEGKGAGAEGFGTPAERGAGRGHPFDRSRRDPDSRTERMGKEDPREGEGTREAGGRAADDGDPAQGAVRERDSDREAVPGSAEGDRGARVGPAVEVPRIGEQDPGGTRAGHAGHGPRGATRGMGTPAPGTRRGPQAADLPEGEGDGDAGRRREGPHHDGRWRGGG